MNIFQQFIKSLYSPKHIGFFRFQGIGQTISYVFFVMLISCSPFVIYSTHMTTSVLGDLQTSIKKDLPSFTIEDGILTSSFTKTKVAQNGDTEIIFDPSGTVSAIDIQNKEQAIGLLKNEIVLSIQGQTQSFPYLFPTAKNVTNEQVVSYIDTLQSYLVIFLPVLFLMYYLFVSAVGFIKVSIFAALGSLMNKGLKRKIEYRHSFRIAAYAITPSIVIMTILGFAHIQLPYSFLLNWLLTILMMYFTIRAIPLPKSKI
ncbi:DUF1189 domain-containing protein [Bacillus sp. FJAT-52991]|uniref:DUF1189 domain-containing protein n=1 Tax=Bacillus kandeliae TaxID=3129297 RepID=A0ABZ2N356_9BACI